jgi:hypothetical protein
MVDAHAQEPVHEVLLVPGARGAGHDHFIVRIEQELRGDPPRCLEIVQWPRRPATQEDFLDPVAAALDVDTAARGNLRARLVAALRARLQHQNLILLHPCVRDRFDDEEIRRYYRETWPALIQAAEPAFRVKCLQPIAWRAAPPLKRLGARVASALWPGMGRAEWVDEGYDEVEATALVEDLTAAGGHVLRICALPPLAEIPDTEVEEFCQRLGLSIEQRRRLLARVRSVSRTPEDFFQALDEYYPEVCGTSP